MAPSNVSALLWQRFKTQAGISLVEMSIALAIIAASCSLLLQYAHRQAQSSAQAQSRDLMARAQKSLLAYAQIYGRLPCPAQDLTGKETCNHKPEGYFPFATLGLPEKKTGALHYRLGDFSALTAPQPLQGLLAEVSEENGVSVKVGQAPSGPQIALCQALSQKGNSGDFAFQLRPDSNLPFAQVLAGSQLTLSYTQVLDRLHCQGHLMAAARAHRNAILAASTLTQAFKDYYQERSFMSTMILGDVIGFSYDIFNSALTLQRTVPMISNAWSEYHLKEGLDNTVWGVVSSYYTVVSDATNSARYITLLTRASMIFVANRHMMTLAEELMGSTEKLKRRIELRAQSSAESGFLWTQASTPPEQP